MTSAERMARLRERRQARDLVQVNLWVPRAAVADLQRAAELMVAAPHLTVARLADTVTGKLVGLRGTPKTGV